MLSPIYRPGDKLFIHRLPPDMPPGTTLSVTIGGVEKELLGIDGLAVKPPRRQANQQRQERFTLLEMEFGQDVVVQELQVNFTTSEVYVVGRIDSVLALESHLLTPRRSALTTYYERKGKKKVLHAYFQGAGHPFLNIERVLEGYDRVYCVDTNTASKRSGQKVAVTTALATKSEKLGEHALHVASDHTIQVVAEDPPQGNPELHGIWAVLGFLVKNHPELVQGRLAIITDTELGMVKSWNDRSKPFYDGHCLPDSVDIFYATADAGSDEFMPNRLMKACDTLSTIKLREVLA